jgi:hypothetical protein
MPKRSTPHIDGTRKYLQNCSFELLCAHWFVKTGWQVFTPHFDHGHRTDLLVSDGPHYYRIQVKTVEESEDTVVENRWSGSHVHYVALFVRNSSWGTIFPAFTEAKRNLKDVGGAKFAPLTRAAFMKAFHGL